MADNVIILGAGSSHAAGIPLMGDLMDTMWQMARTEKWKGVPLKAADINTLKEALKVREELDSYHGRAALDVWNIEDVLSILSFNAMTGGEKEAERVVWMTKAIAAVIEITCVVTHDGALDTVQENAADQLYQEFWRSLIDWCIKNSAEIPPILTFNYDLVLERSLLHTLVGTHYRGNQKFDFDGIEIDYGATVFPPITLAAKRADWTGPGGHSDRKPGNILAGIKAGAPAPSKTLNFKIHKLHGSVNFPTPTSPPGDCSEVERLIKASPIPSFSRRYSIRPLPRSGWTFGRAR